MGTSVTCNSGCVNCYKEESNYCQNYDSIIISKEVVQNAVRNISKIILLQNKIRKFLYRTNTSLLKRKSKYSKVPKFDNDNSNFSKALKELNNLSVLLNYHTQVKDYSIGNGKYTGEMFNNMRHGKGEIVWCDSTRYEGEWKNDKAEGFGTFYHIDGDVYQGYWKSDMANGEGTYISNDGSIYKGSWLNDLQEGKGFESWPDGSTFKGEYKAGKKNGYGNLFFK